MQQLFKILYFRPRAVNPAQPLHAFHYLSDGPTQLRVQYLLGTTAAPYPG